MAPVAWSMALRREACGPIRQCAVMLLEACVLIRHRTAASPEVLVSGRQRTAVLREASVQLLQRTAAVGEARLQSPQSTTRFPETASCFASVSRGPWRCDSRFSSAPRSSQSRPPAFLVYREAPRVGLPLRRRAARLLEVRLPNRRRCLRERKNRLQELELQLQPLEAALFRLHQQGFIAESRERSAVQTPSPPPRGMLFTLQRVILSAVAAPTLKREQQTQDHETSPLGLR